MAYSQTIYLLKCCSTYVKAGYLLQSTLLKIIFTIFYFLLVITTVKSQVSRAYSNEFLTIGVDAAALAQSNAVVATTNDVNSGYWNPAGLVHLEDNQIALQHAEYFGNIANYDYAAFGKPIDERSAIGFSIIRFGVDDILNTTQLIDDQGNIDFNRISLFSTADWAFTFSYARELLLDGLNIGANAKVVRRVIGDFASSWGFGLDLGIQFQRGNWQFGFTARDVTTTVNAWSIDEDEFATIQNAVEGQNTELPESTELTLPSLQFGVGRSWLFHYDYSLRAEIDFNARFIQTNDIISSPNVSISPAIGFEFGYADLVFVRGGLGNFQDINDIGSGLIETEVIDPVTGDTVIQQSPEVNSRLSFQPNIGVGFKYKGIYVDYALTDIGDQSAAIFSNIFSLKIDWELFRPRPVLGTGKK